MSMKRPIFTVQDGQCFWLMPDGPNRYITPDDAKAINDAAVTATDLARRLDVATVALRQFADPANWHDAIGSLTWQGKRHAMDFAESTLNAIAPKLEKRDG